MRGGDGSPGFRKMTGLEQGHAGCNKEATGPTSGTAAKRANDPARRCLTWHWQNS